MFYQYTLPELEKIIISGIINTLGIGKVCDVLSEDDFLSKKEKLIYRTMLTYFSKGNDDWFVQTFSELQKDKITFSEYFSCNTIVISSNILFYVKELKKLKRKMLLSDLFVDSQARVNSEKLDDFIISFNKKFSEITADKMLTSGDIETTITEYENLQEVYADKIKNGIELLGIDTGFSYINKAIDGLRESHLWIVGGYTGSGKTFLSLNIVVNLIRQKKRVGFYSLEMSKVDIFGRLLGIMLKENSLKLLKGFTSPETHQQIKDVKNKIKESKMFLYTELSDLETIKLSMIRENMRNKVDLFVLDYIQLLQANGKSEYENMKEAITELQRVAIKLKVSIIVLSQISNEAAKNRNSVVMGFKGSGDIAAAADLAIELLPDKVDLDTEETDYKTKYETNVKMVIKKNRHGLSGSQNLTFDKYTGLFSQKSDF